MVDLWSFLPIQMDKYGSQKLRSLTELCIVLSVNSVLAADRKFLPR